jgi:hypothetical protein
MGGYGSGRWGTGKGDAKALVESCRVLDIGLLVRDGVVRPDRSRRGKLSWSRDGEEVASIGYQVDTRADGGTFRLTYSVGRDGREKAAQDYVVPLVTTSLVSGGRRWWFRCVACREGGPPCGRRAGKLYLPPGGRVFACRRCHDLAYSSSRESRKWDGMFRHLAASAGLPLATVKSAMKRDRRGRSRGDEE